MKNNDFNSQSSRAQRQRLLTALREAGSSGINTIQAREVLDIMAPAARVHELRHNDGHNVQNVGTTELTAEGNTHRVARYVLMAGKWKDGGRRP